MYKSLNPLGHINNYKHFRCNIFWGVGKLEIPVKLKAVIRMLKEKSEKTERERLEILVDERTKDLKQ